MSTQPLHYVTLRDYRQPHHAGWAMSLARLGFARLRAYLENPKNLLRTPGLPVDGKSLAGDLFDQIRHASPGVHIDLDAIPDERLLYYGWRFPIKTRTTTKRAA
jgi:hypothetical protein